MRRTWIKLFCDQWLRGSIRKESIEVRAIFADLLTMAGDSAFGDPNVASNGFIQLADDVGFTDETISGILNVSLETWLRVKDRLSNHPDPKENRIQVVSLSQGFSVKILNWEKYQSEYRRQRKYREAKKEERSPTPPKEEKEDIDIEGEGEGEEIVTQVTKEVTKKVTKKEEILPTPNNLDFSLKRKVDKMKTQISDYEEALKGGEKACLKEYQLYPKEVKGEIRGLIKEVNRIIDAVR